MLILEARSAKKESMIITIANQKGGVGKTTTSLNLFCGLKRKGYKVLAIDLDPQCNLSMTFNANCGTKTVLNVLLGANSVDECIQTAPMGEIIASTTQLSGADAFLKGPGSEYRLKDALDEMQEKYDFIIIDTPPALGILSVNAYVAAERVIIPVQAGIYSFEGLDLIMDSLVPIKKHCNKDLKVDGILITMYNERTNLSKALLDGFTKYAETKGTKMYRSTIRESVRIGEAQLQGKNLYDFAPGEKVTKDYENFVEEFLSGVNEA